VKFRHLVDSLFRLYLSKDELWDLTACTANSSLQPKRGESEKVKFISKYVGGVSMIKKNLCQYFSILDSKFKSSLKDG